MEPINHTDDDADNEEFFFESDHLALRGNVDYTTVLRSLVVLEAQRMQAVKDIDKIALAEREALQNPEEFIKKLSLGQDLNLPGPISIIDVPTVNFGKYNVVFPDTGDDEKREEGNNTDITVRGRVFDQTKPETFNQLWTCEEQKRLEELLVEYPPEPIEMRRFAKIARALGNRTTKQVASRVQKFFKKLHSVGMPVPGRLPKSHRQYMSKANRINRHALRPSTFFPAQDVPVTMPEDDDPICGTTEGVSQLKFTDNEPNKTISSKNFIVVDHDSDDDDSNDVDNDETNEVARILARVKRDKEKDSNSERLDSEHDGFFCDSCGDSPIFGTRWHCTTCIHTSIDYCSDCFVTQAISSLPHPLSHKFDGIRMLPKEFNKGRSYVSSFDADLADSQDEESKPSLDLNSFDKDYMPSKFTKDEEYNYLDPNFLPD